MSYHPRLKTQARLEAHAAVLGMSADEYLEALLERQSRFSTRFGSAPNPPFSAIFVHQAHHRSIPRGAASPL